MLAEVGFARKVCTHGLTLQVTCEKLQESQVCKVVCTHAYTAKVTCGEKELGLFWN
jgi:hypothetical protein